jgi:hypothetical protein
MRGTQGAMIVASTLQIVLGFSGLWRNVLRLVQCAFPHIFYILYVKTHGQEKKLLLNINLVLSSPSIQIFKPTVSSSSGCAGWIWPL